jgi:hypothetical protein
MAVRLTVRATGFPAVLLLAGLIAAVFVLPRVVSDDLSRAEAESAARDLWGREIRDRWLPTLQVSPPESAHVHSARMGAAFDSVASRRIETLDVKRSWVGPPFARRWAYVAAVRTSASAPPEYIRVSRGLATRVSPAWWWVPLL